MGNPSLRPATKQPDPGWRFVFYIAESGKCEVWEMLEELRETDFPSYTFFLNNILEPLKENGPFALPKPYWEDLGNGFSDLSWGRHRIYCCVEPPRRVFALLAVPEKRFRSFFSKKGRLVEKCESRRADIRSGNYDEGKRNAAFQEYRRRRTGSQP